MIALGRSTMAWGRRRDLPRRLSVVPRRLVGAASMAVLAVFASCLAKPGWAWDSTLATVHAPAGAITGEAVEAGIGVYKGIPYARPPIGPLRWKPPEPAPHSTEVVTATAYGPACPQKKNRAVRLSVEMSEDCLTLNIWTGAKSPADRLPVMVWIHGGGFQLGSGSEAVYDGRRLAQNGVVVVTINYRLGPLGFLAHPALAAESTEGASGNYGLMDQILALRWVHDNIQAFGGDPANITAFGQSAGGVSVATLMASPLASGLFQRAIVESSGIDARLRFADRANGKQEPLTAIGLRFAEELGVSGKDAAALASLRQKPWKEILDAWDQTLKQGGMAGEGTRNHLGVDGHVLKEQPMQTFARGRQLDIPLIIGGVSGEGSLFAYQMKLNSLRRYRRFTERLFGQAAPRYLELYPANDDASASKAASALIGDMFFLPIRTTAEAMAAVQRDTYMFEFKRVGGKAAKSGFGSYHGIEMPYVFGTLSELGSFNDDDVNVSKQVMGYWTTFARTGNPNGRNGKWPRFDRATRSYLQIDVASVPKTQFHTARLDALLNLRAPGSAKPKRRDGDRRGGGRSKPARPRERARRCPGAEGSTRRLPDARTIP